MMAAQVQIDSDLSKIDRKSFDTMRKERLAKGNQPAHPEHIRLRNDALKAYAPLDRIYDLDMNELVYVAEVIPGMSRAAAQGIMAAREQEYFDSPAGQQMWNRTLSRIWPRIVATDKKQATWQERMAALRKAS